MMNLWGFEKQATLSRMADGRVGLRQTANPTTRQVLVKINPTTGTDRTQRTRLVDLIQDGNATAPDIGNIIEALRRAPADGEQGDALPVDTRANISANEQVGWRVRQVRSQVVVTNPAAETAEAPPPPPTPAPAAAAPAATVPPAAPSPNPSASTPEERMQTERLAHEAEERRERTANEAAERREQRALLAAQSQQQLPSAGAQFASATLNPIAGAFGGLANAAAIASLGMNNNVSAISTPFGSSYQASGLGAVGGGYGLGNPLLASLGGVGNYGGTALSNFGGGMDILGLGNTFYGQAMDERSRARQLDAEINRLKMMIMSGNMDAILQAVTLLTLRSKSTLRNAAATMITSMQNSNRQMEVQNNRLEGLSGNNTRSSQANQSEMMSINNQIQGINMDRQTAMNAVRDMMSALEEQTSTEQGIRRGFEQLRQISSWRA